LLRRRWLIFPTVTILGLVSIPVNAMSIEIRHFPRSGRSLASLEALGIGTNDLQYFGVAERS